MTGFVVPTCRCGHPVGSHQGGRSYGLRAARYGLCLEPDCDCTRFVEVLEETTGQDDDYE